MPYSAYEHLLVDIEDGVATVTLNRPEKYNALNNATFFDLQADRTARHELVGTTASPTVW